MWTTLAIGFVFFLLLIILYDLMQSKHAILRNFPIIGHFRYWLEAVGPELRQYIVSSNNEERPFSRDQRRWVYASAKKENNYFGFGTDEKLELEPNLIIIKHSAFGPAPAADAGFPVTDALPYTLPCAKVLGGHRCRDRAFRPSSVVNISGMSYGSLSGPAVEAMNRGAGLSGCLHNTGEGGISQFHGHGGDLIWQIGTGYFGCRAADGGFDQARFLDTVAEYPVKAIELKLSQGAKPGLGGLLPGAKVSAEIASIRGVPVGKDVISPCHHTAFGSVDEMLDFVEGLADATGLPIGIKSSVGEDAFWRDLAG